MIFDDDIIDEQSKMIENLKKINSELRSKNRIGRITRI